MRMRGGFLGLALIGMAMPALSMAAIGGQKLLAQSGGQTADAVKPTRRRTRAAVQAQPRKYRSRWKAERRKPRRNMRHVSRRVRRRHRRAA